MDKKEKTLSSELIYKGKIIDLYKDRVLCPNGHESVRELVRHCKASCVLAFLDNGEVLLEDQYRYPFDDILKEIPAGKCEPGEDPEICAVRELEEETGYRAGHIEFLGLFLPTVAYTDERIYVYLATGLTTGKQHLDENETLDYYSVPFEKLCDMIRSGEVTDGKTVYAVCQYLLRKK